MRKVVVRRLWLYGAAGVVAAALLTLSLRAGPGEADLGTLLNGADMLARVGAHEKARENCAAVLRRDPGNLAAHLILGFTYEAEDRFAEAYETYLRARELTSDRPLLLEVDLSLADLCRRLGRRQEALRRLEEVEGEHPEEPRVHLVRGLVHAGGGAHEDALGSLVRARKSPATEDFSTYHMGLSLRALGRTAEALAAFERLARRNGKDFDAWYEIARCRLLLEDRAGMFTALDRARKLSPARIRKRLAVDPDFEPVRDDPRFREVTEG